MSETEQVNLAIAPVIPEGNVALTPEGEAVIERALVEAAHIGRVSNPEENKSSVSAQLGLKRVLKDLEDVRVALVAAPLKQQRDINQFFKEKSKELNDELWRLSKLSTDFIQLEEMKARAEENRKREELTKIEKEREAELAKATSHDQADAIREHFDNKAAAQAAPPAPTVVRPKGQTAKSDWDVSVTDVYALAKRYPNCVSMTPKMSEIKSLLNAGIDLPGVSATKKMVANVRLAPTKTIDV